VSDTWHAKNTAEDRHRFSDQSGLDTELARRRSGVPEVAPGPGFLAIQLAKQGIA